MLKKSKFVALGVAVMIICSLFIPSVQSMAESAMSVFRVEDAKTIRISVTELQSMLTSFQSLSQSLKNQSGAIKDETSDMQILMEKLKSKVKTLTSVKDFTSFSFNLPTSLKDTPRLYAVGSETESITLNTDKINAVLTKLGAKSLVDGSYNGTKITASTSPSIVAEYPDVLMFATKGANIDASSSLVNNLWASFISIPAIPSGLYAQLKAIDPQSKNIYLPVIEGLGRETSISGTTGYIYSTTELAKVISAFPELSNEKLQSALTDKNASALIWTKNGILYCMVGQKSDSELSQIARSVK